MDLKDKAINIQGKGYILVSDRVLAFNADYPNGAIQTEMVRMEGEMIIVKATAIPDCTMPARFFTGYAQEIIGDGFINKTSALENAETSAVGRALGMMGIGVLDSIASADEIHKAQNREDKTLMNGPRREYPKKPTYDANSKEAKIWIDIPFEGVADLKALKLEWAKWNPERGQWSCFDSAENRAKLKSLKQVKALKTDSGEEITL